jgi:hypothetical protein
MIIVHKKSVLKRQFDFFFCVSGDQKVETIIFHNHRFKYHDY